MKRIVLLGILALLIITIPAAAQDMPCQAGGQNYDNPEICQASVEVSIAYPTWILGNPATAEVVTGWIGEVRSQFLTAAAGYWDTFTFSYSLDISFEETALADQARSVVFTISEYTGGAHPNGYFQTYTVDANTGELLTLADIFSDVDTGLLAVSGLAAQSILNSMGEMADAQWVTDGTAPEPVNFQNWALADGVLRVYFPPYQVGPHAMGPQIVDIPLSDLYDLLAPRWQALAS